MKTKLLQRIFLVIVLFVLAVLWIPQLTAAWPSDSTVNVPICTAADSQEYPQIVSDGAGGAIITWQDARSGNYDIYAQRVNASGAVLWSTDGVPICTAAGDQFNPQLVSDGAGGAIITWQDYRSSDTSDIYAQCVFSDGSLPVTLSSFTATASDGKVTLIWRTETEVNNVGFDIYRSDAKDGKYMKVNARLIQGAGTDATPHDYSFTDEDVVFGKTYYYYIEDVDFSGKTNRSHILEVTVDKQSIKKEQIPLKFVLLQNYPNPFNPETWIPYELAESAEVTLDIYDFNGRVVRSLRFGQKPAGVYIDKERAIYWDGHNEAGEQVPSGIYFYRLQVAQSNRKPKASVSEANRLRYTAVRKMVVLK